MHLFPVDSYNTVEKYWSETVIIFAAIIVFNSGRTDKSLFHDQDTGMIIITKEWIVGRIYKKEITNPSQIFRYNSFCCYHINMRRSPTVFLNIQNV